MSLRRNASHDEAEQVSVHHENLTDHGWEPHNFHKDDGNGHKVEYRHPSHENHAIHVNLRTGFWTHKRGKKQMYGGEGSLKGHLNEFHGSSQHSEEPSPVTPLVYSESYFQPSVRSGEEINEQFAENDPNRAKRSELPPPIRSKKKQTEHIVNTLKEHGWTPSRSHPTHTEYVHKSHPNHVMKVHDAYYTLHHKTKQLSMGNYASINSVAKNLK